MRTGDGKGAGVANGGDWDPAAAVIARAAGRERFEAGDFAAARAAFRRAFAAGDASPDTVAALQALHADAGDHAAIARLLDAALDRAGVDLDRRDHIAWAAALLDATLLGAGSTANRADAALRLLETAAALGGDAWDAVLAPSRRAALIAACADPLATLDRLEQEAYAPAATGLPAAAAAEAAGLGLRHAADPAIARAAERLLHGLGARDAAYQVEDTRRAAAQARDRASGTPAAPAEPDANADLRGLVVLVVGGHPALRRLVRADLARSGVADLRELPSAWEASRPTRAVRDLLAGADLAVLVWRQLAHSTADRVRVAAGQLGVPVVLARTAGAGAVRRAIEEGARRRSP